MSPRKHRHLSVGRFAGVLAVVAVVGTPACRRDAGESTLEKRPWNLLLVTLDTTRADHLACYGHEQIETPTIDRLARDGIRYSRCYSPAPLTLPTHASIMTGWYPFYHGVRDNGIDLLHEDAQTLAETLGQHGYRTGAVVAAYVLHSRYGLNQGFEYYEDDFSGASAPSKFFMVERNAQAVNQAAIRWLDGLGDEPFFLWVHYFDPHAPYQPPGYRGNDASPTAYDREIAYADSQLERLLQPLDRIERATQRETLIVFTSDHGESLGKHGEPTHGFFTYNDTLRVPLIVRLPSARRRGVVVDAPVSLVDIFPSVLRWLDVPPPCEMHGRVLPTSDGDLEDPSQSARPLYFETYFPYNSYRWSPLEGVIVGQQKYVAAPGPQFYDLSVDPGETQDLFSQGDPRIAALQRALAELKDSRLDTSSLTPEAVDVDEESRRKLEALGYVGTILPSEPPAESLADPRDMLQWHLGLLEAQTAITAGHFTSALELLERVLEVDPDNPRALQLLVGLLDEPEARAAAITLSARNAQNPPAAPFHVMLPLKLGIALGHERRFQEAAEALRQALEADPDSAAAHYALAHTLTALDRRLDECFPHFKKAHGLDPDNQEYALGLTRCYEQLGAYEQAFQIYDGMLERNPDDTRALNNSAYLYHKLRQEPELALERSRQAVSVDPDSPHLRLTLACILLRADQAKEAANHLQKMLESDRDNPVALYHLGLARQQLGDRKGARTALQRAVRLAGRTPFPWMADARARLAELRTP